MGITCWGTLLPPLLWALEPRQRPPGRQNPPPGVWCGMRLGTGSGGGTGSRGDRQVPPGPAVVAQVALTCVSQPRTSCCHHDALPQCVAVPCPAPRRHAELLRMEPCLGKTGRKQVKWLFLPSCLQGMEYEQLTTDSRWCPPPAAGLGVMGEATGMCPPGDICQGCPCQPCPHSALARGAPAMQCLPDPTSH